MRVRVLLLVAAMAALAAGCGGSSDKASPRESTAPSASSTADAQQYVDSINAICAAQLPLVLGATNGGHPQHYPIATFNAERPKLKTLNSEFDAKVAAVVIPPAAKPAAATLNDYRKYSDAAEARLATAAATGSQAQFDVAYDANAASFGDVSAHMLAAGFSQDCNSR